MISYFFLIITPKLLYKKPMSNVGKNLLKFEQGNLIYSIPICHLMIDKHSRENNVRPMYIERL